MLKLAVLSLLAVSTFARVPDIIQTPFDDAQTLKISLPLPEPEPKEFNLVKPEPKTVKCGQAPLYETERIINGSYSPTQSSFPFMVNIKWGWQHWCGGAVYDKYTVISAAHCFWEGQNLKKLKLFFADFDQKKGHAKENGQEKRGVKSITIHPEYDSTWFHNDIAILKLDQALPFDDKIQPICMPSVEVTGGEDTIVMGWGYTYGTADGNKLNYAHVPVIPRDVCRQRDWYSVAITEHMVCAGFAEGLIDSCQGDSGGPLALQNEAGDFELIGIVSWGAGCANPKSPGVYVDVYDYIDWIKENAGEPQY